MFAKITKEEEEKEKLQRRRRRKRYKQIKKNNSFTQILEKSKVEVVGNVGKAV